MDEQDTTAVLMRHWLPIILQTLGILIAAFAYNTAMEHRLTQMEEMARADRAQLSQYVDNQKIIISELKVMNERQNGRLELLETNQARILALEDYAYRNRK